MYIPLLHALFSYKRKWTWAQWSQSSCRISLFRNDIGIGEFHKGVKLFSLHWYIHSCIPEIGSIPYIIYTHIQTYIRIFFLCIAKRVYTSHIYIPTIGWQFIWQMWDSNPWSHASKNPQVANWQLYTHGRLECYKISHPTAGPIVLNSMLATSNMHNIHS